MAKIRNSTVRKNPREEIGGVRFLFQAAGTGPLSPA